MATGITAAGLGSGIDVGSLVTQLMAAERTPINQLNARSTSYKSQLSAFGTLKGFLSTLQTAAQAISTTEKFAAFKASVADATVASAAASGKAAAGSYSLEVSQLAQAQKAKSAGFATSSSTVASGTLTLEMGEVSGGTFTADATKTKNIVIDSSNNTLSGLRDAINASGAGVTATLVNDGSATPVRLVLTSKESGTTHAFKLSGIAGLDYDPATATGSMSKIQDAKDALFKLDGIDIKKSSNVVTDAVDGLTLTLAKTNEGAPTTIAVTNDTSAVESKINEFIKAYNAVVTNIKSQSAYDATTKKAGTLNGDATVRSIQTQLRNIVGGTLAGGDMTRLAEAGINIAVDGALSVDTTKLQAALNNPTKNVAALFGSANSVDGFAKQIADRVGKFLDADGMLTARTEGINKTITDFSKRIETLEKRMESIEARYRRQFSALDSTVASWNSTSSYLQQQLASLL